jgi:hypothetical protein
LEIRPPQPQGIGALDRRPRIAALADRLDAIRFEGSQNRKTQLLDKLDAAMAAFVAEEKKAIGLCC